MAAGDIVIKGDQTLIKQPDVLTITPEEGTATESTWMGNPAAVDAKVTALQDAAEPPARIDVQRGPVSVVKAYFPYENAQGKAELIPEVIEKRLESFPRWSTGSDDAVMLERIQKALTEGKAAEDPKGTEKDWDAEYGTDFPAGTGSGFNLYRDLRLLGTDSYYGWTYRIRWTLPKALVQDEQIIITDIGRVWTYNEVIEYIQAVMTIPILWGRPSINLYVPGSDFIETALDEWLLMPCAIEKQGRNYFLVMEWIGALSWSGTLYPDGGNTP
jgi:hypothetical protein